MRGDDCPSCKSRMSDTGELLRGSRPIGDLPVMGARTTVTHQGAAWAAVLGLRRDRYRCRICGRDASDGVKLEVDHKMPVMRGGPSTAENLWTLCFDCNRGKYDQTLDARGSSKDEC